MKKLLCILVALTMLCGMSALAEGVFTPGTYEAEAQGLFVPVKVTVTVSETEITDIQINAEGETPALGGAAADMMKEAILKAQTPNVDGLTGATVTSAAIVKAATEALVAAGADIAALDANRKDLGSEEAPKEEKTVETDIVIIGAGGAGMAAAIMAHQAGMN